MMNIPRLTLFGVVTTLILAGGTLSADGVLLAAEPPGSPKEHVMHVAKLKGDWKVMDADDSSIRTVTAKNGETITWMPMGSDVSFQFPDSTLFGVYSISAKAGKKLSLEVSPDAKSGRYVYSIFCLKDGAFATGNSPPVIIIE